MPLIDKLAKKDGFTDVESDIASFVLSNPDDVARMSIDDLAAHTFTSKSTIVRFCRKLGTSGYREFRVAYASEVERRRLAKHSVDVNRPFVGGRDTATVASNIAALQREAIDATYASLDFQEVQAAADAIASARHVYLYAGGDTLVSGLAFANQLAKLGIMVIHATEYDETLSRTLTANKGDVALLLSYSGTFFAHHRYDASLDILGERGVTTVFVSAGEPPRRVDVRLALPQQESRAGKVATYYSQECVRYTLNCLYGAIYASNFAESSTRVDRVFSLENSFLS